MQSQQEQDIVEPATVQDHVQSPGKGKGVLSKVKHKARKLKDKVKKVTHSGNKAHDDKHGHLGDRERAGLHPTLAHEGKDSSGDSADDYDYDSEEQENELDDSQMKYERLPSAGASDTQGDGSDVELHGGVPASATTVEGSYWKSGNDDSPVSIYKSAGPPDTLQATPTEYRNYAAINDDLSLKGSDKSQEMKPPSGKGVDVGNPLGPVDLAHDQIGVYSEDLSADRKLGIGIASDRYRDSSEDMGMSARDTDKHVERESPERKLGSGIASGRYRDSGEDTSEDTSMSARDTHKHVEHESSPSSPVDGAHEQIYRPVAEPEDFRASLPSESINASLYGDVLAAEDKLTRSAPTGDDYPSNQSEEEFSFDKQNLSNKRPDMHGTEPENIKDVVAVQDKASVDDSGEGQDGSEGAEGWGKWSANKLNNAVDNLALKVAGGDMPKEHMVVGENDRSIDREASDVSYYDPNDLQDNKFQEHFVLGSSGIADLEENALLDSAVAGSAAIVGKLTELKDSIASTLGIGGNETPADVPHADIDEHSDKEGSLTLKGGESSKGEDDTQQTGFLQGLKETMGSAFGVGIAPQADSDEHSGKERSLSLHGGELGESSKGEDDMQKTGFLRGLKETMGSAFGVGNELSEREPTSDEKPHLTGTDSNLESPKSGRLSHEWSLSSASDVPQAAFL